MMAEEIMQEQAHIAPCGVNCVLCYAYQRAKNKCPGCNGSGEMKPYHCRKCAIAGCGKPGRTGHLCSECIGKFPCARLRSLDKRYCEKYGVSLVGNLHEIGRAGLEAFGYAEQEKWKCRSCGGMLCIHKPECPHCGGRNPHFPGNTPA